MKVIGRAIAASTLALGVSACAQIAGLGDYHQGTAGAAGSTSHAGAGGTPTTGHAGTSGGNGIEAGAAAESGAFEGGAAGESGASGAAETGGLAGKSGGGTGISGASGATGGVGGSRPGGGGAGGSFAGGNSGGRGGNGGSAGAGPVSVCGNGLTEGAEGCDDNNTNAGDGCSATCALETGFACSGVPSACNRSCNGLAATCGPTANGDCCASNAVLGIGTATFYRSYDGQTAGYTSKTFPALVSSFRLDKYEITVGRFRKFVAAYSPTMIPNGAGKNPNNQPADSGWDAANWNASLDGDAAQLKAALALCAPYSTWTDTVGTALSESRPIDCLDWFEAQAFCIWDGGRLPTEAEWNYAAAGGTEQRIYPWGFTAPAADMNLANYKCCPTPASVAPVGSIAAGNGKWGQSDLAGGVYEWTQDWFGVYPATCNNCAVLATGTYRVIRGGGFLDAATALPASIRSNNGPSIRNNFFDLGARCARNTP